MSDSPWAAGRYESVGERIARIAEQTVATADRRHPLAGATVVDLACGTGSAALAATARGATVTGVDLTAELIDLAVAKAGASSITWVTADASDTGLPDHSFDALVSNMGIVFVDPDRQVPELARLLKPAGTLAFSSWRRDADNPFFDPLVDVLGERPAMGFSPDQWGDPAIVEQRLAADFTDVEIDDGTFTWEMPSLDAALHFLEHESPMHVAVFRHADADQRSRLRAAFRAALEPHTTAAGVSFGSSYVVVSARRRA